MTDKGEFIIATPELKFLSFTPKVDCLILSQDEQPLYECTYLLPSDPLLLPQFTDIYDEVLLYGDVGFICHNNHCEIVHSKYPGRVGLYVYEANTNSEKYLVVSDEELP